MVILTGMLAAGRSPCSAQAVDVPPPPPAEWLRIGGAWVEEWLDEGTLETLERLLTDRGPALLGLVAVRLQDVDWEALPPLRPLAADALRILAQHPEGRPYAAWLFQRLDYLEMADAFVRARQMPSSPVPPPSAIPASPPLPTLRPPEAAAVAPSRSDWQNKIQHRSRPNTAPVLIPRMKAAFRAEGVPEALVWVAEVESSLNPEARSPAGAAGLFQFMPATAEAMGLRLRPRDERLDPDISARAAARYLRILYRRFSGWELALAAYNCGQGRVAGALRSRKATCFEGIQSTLPLETRMYVPKVLALVQVREGLDAHQIPPPRP